MLGFLTGLVALLSVISLMVGVITAQARLLKQCLNITFGVAVVLLLVPPFTPLGLVLLAVSGAMIVMGKCKACESKMI